MSNVFMVYVSNRTDPTDGMLVRDIAIESSQSNRSKEISGILMAVGNYFLQVLEGQEGVVDQLLERIAQDERHTDIRVLYRGTLPDRIFGQWSMGCVQSNGESLQSEPHFEEIRVQIDELCTDLTQEKSEKLRDLIVRIPQLLAEERVSIA